MAVNRILAAIARQGGGKLLDAATHLVKTGGTIVFSNCSLDPIEGEEMIAEFLAANEDFVIAPLKAGEVAGADTFINVRGELRTTSAEIPG